MANKIILYNLTNAERAGSKRNGKIPTYIAEGGWFPNVNSNDPPADYDFIGATVDGSSEEGLRVFANQAAVKTYIESIHPPWPETMRPAELPAIGVELGYQHPEGFSSSTAVAASIWSFKID